MAQQSWRLVASRSCAPKYEFNRAYGPACAQQLVGERFDENQPYYLSSLLRKPLGLFGSSSWKGKCLYRA